MQPQHRTPLLLLRNCSVNPGHTGFTRILRHLSSQPQLQLTNWAIRGRMRLGRRRLLGG
jgi:hypothetical protein